MSSDESLTPQPDFTESSDRMNYDSPTEPISAQMESDSSSQAETIAVSFTEITESSEASHLPIAEIPHESIESAVTETQSWDEPDQVTPLTSEVDQLKLDKAALERDIQALQAQKARMIAHQTQDIQEAIAKLVQDGLQSFEQRKQSLEITIEQLERKRDRIREEMRSTFAGASQDLAIRVQGFKDYLVGSLQDLAAAAEQLDLVPESEKNWDSSPPVVSSSPAKSKDSVSFSPSKFEDQNRRIQDLLDQYRSRPDYYGPPWQLRRTFEPIHAERVRKWFQVQGGRGAIRSLGSRLQNILVASAVISILYKLYGDRSRALILANSPERLGEWRRGLQDCLGISRADFGSDRGISLFESPEAMVQKAERLQEDGLSPFVIVDESEEEINLSLLQFSLWLAFVPDPQQSSNYSY